jgi:uncharacterized protein (TIGR02391 family)
MAIPLFELGHLEQICSVLADTNSGLTGSEIGRLLQQLGIADPNPIATKRVRLYDALMQRQSRDRSGNNVGAFIEAAMNPVRYRSNAAFFEDKRAELNTVLAFCGYAVGQDGRLREVQRATTLTEAQERASRLRGELIRRNVHPDVLAFCRAELLEENYFHAVFEATKSVADKIREKSGLITDGADLVDQALSGSQPKLAINSLTTETEQSEQRGFATLLKGMFGTFRNVTAHAPRVRWPIHEQDAMDLLSLASYLHRRLDGSVRTPW